jgi:pilus retraction protein PilT
VFRNIPSTILSLDELNAPKTFKDLCMLPRGLVLVTGPTGSGKSTTLAGMVNHCNDNRPDHIITIEDPIEFVHESKRCLVNQREVHRDTLGFSEALRSALREDPDVVLVGEMRDLETIRLALTAAETGHLVFGTLHTSSAAKTIDRIVDVFPAAEKDMVRAMLSESLRAVISQTLMKRVGGGRIAAHEIMIGTPAIRNLIREGKIAQMYSAIQTGQGQGMQTLDQCLQELVQKGVVSREEARSTRRRTRTASNGTRTSNTPDAGPAAAHGREKGSDLFITAGFPPAIKVDGEIRPQSDRSLSPEQSAGMVRAIMNDRQTKEFDATKECNFAIAPPGIGRFRVSAFVQQGFTGAVLRTINAKIPTLEELELPPVLKEVVLSKRGFVILVGGTGSGKSTSLAAMVGYRNEKTRGHIVTIEDPVEYVHAHKGCVVTHREVGVDCESWHLALKNTLRQAPDVILIGEIRDRETMEYGIQFAETGHLVLATLHANSSNQALDRIINFFPEERREQLLMDLVAEHSCADFAAPDPARSRAPGASRPWKSCWRRR